MENRRRFAAIDALIRDIRAVTDDDSNWVAFVGATIDIAREQEANPYAMLDVLEAGIVSIVLTLPPEKRTAAAAAVMRLLLDQFRSNGIG